MKPTGNPARNLLPIRTFIRVVHIFVGPCTTTILHATRFKNMHIVSLVSHIIRMNCSVAGKKQCVCVCGVEEDGDGERTRGGPIKFAANDF